MKVYKIRNRITGLFSCGGQGRNFSKVGKTWSTIGFLKSHLRESMKQWSASRGTWEEFPAKYKDCEIVEFEVLEKENLSVEEFIREKMS